jgi:hypothetical protein
MPNTLTEALGDWLLRLVGILRADGGAAWRVLNRVVAGRTGVIQLDASRLRLRGLGEGEGLRVEVEPATEADPLNFRSDAETLRDVLAGRLTVDAAVASGAIYVCASLHDLLGIHELVLAILALAPIRPALRGLWDDFDSTWPRPAEPPPCRPVQGQVPRFGYLTSRVPLSVLRVEIE